MKVRTIWPEDRLISERKIRMALSDELANMSDLDRAAFNINPQDADIQDVVDVLNDLGTFTFHKDWAYPD